MTLRQRTLQFFHDRPEYKAWALLAPGLFWLLAFFIIPMFWMFGYSFMTRNEFGVVEAGFTLEHYGEFFQPLYIGIVGRDRKSVV